MNVTYFLQKMVRVYAAAPPTRYGDPSAEDVDDVRSSHLRREADTMTADAARRDLVLYGLVIEDDVNGEVIEAHVQQVNCAHKVVQGHGEPVIAGTKMLDR